MIKRSIDFCAALIGILVTLPFYPFLCLVVRVSTRSSAFVREDCVGRGRKLIRLYRFRAPTNDEQCETDGKSLRRALRCVHQFLGDYKLDGLPLFLNVLKGEMSLVGPRPESADRVALYTDEQARVLTVRPGIWGPYSIPSMNGYANGDAAGVESWEEHYRNQILPEKLRVELRYVQNSFLSRDFRVLFGVITRKVKRTIDSQLMNEAKNRNFFLPLDLFLVFCSYLISYNLRFDWSLPDNDYIILFKVLPLVLGLRIVTFYSFGLYKNLWRYVGVNDLLAIIKAVTMSSVLLVSAVYLFGVSDHSRSIFLIDWLVCITFIGGSRLVLRLVNESAVSENKLRKNVLIIGAGDVGEMLLRELKKSGRETYKVVGFVDDDDSIHGRTIHGVKVMGSCDDIPEIVRLFRIDEALITFNQFSSEQMKNILSRCKAADVRHRMVPAVSDVLSGTLHLSRVRDVQISDLFGRDAIELDLSAIKNSLSEKSVLVTGAGGSIGSELCRQISEYQPASIILLDKNENYLHEIYCELRSAFENLQIHSILCDITNRPKAERIFEKFKPQVVFHAAAQKHVPLSEENPDEAAKNNVLGTRNLAKLADKFGVLTFVMVSTDKAVNPTSVMGATKRVAELYVQALSKKSRTKFVTVRFGNVLNSNGSVVPIFRKQIEQGGPITVTHPMVERYFMSISEAVQLILQAETMGKDCEIFILNMGKSIRIVDLAEELIKHAGLMPHEDIQIKFTGLRPGEKLFEELIGRDEVLAPTSHADIKTLKSNYTVSLGNIEKEIVDLTDAIRKNNPEHLLRLLGAMVPEYRSTSWEGQPVIPTDLLKKDNGWENKSPRGKADVIASN